MRIMVQQSINQGAFRSALVFVCLFYFTLFSSLGSASEMVLARSIVTGAIEGATRIISSDFLLTTDSCLRGMEGELAPFIGINPRQAVPLTWRADASGVIHFSTQESQCRYEFHVIPLTIGDATESARVGILSVTVVNLSAQENQAVVWAAWRHAPPPEREKNGTLGFVLAPTQSPVTQLTPQADNWNPGWAWYFHRRAFVQSGRLVYWVPEADGWEMETWARRIEAPYKDLASDSVLGYTRLTAKLAAKGEAGICVIVPYQPCSIEKLSRLEAFWRSSTLKD